MVRVNRQAPRRTSTLVHIKSRRCTVHTGKPKTVTADGDVVSRTPLDVACEPGSLRVIGERVVSTAAGSDAGVSISGAI
jgi:diacylglycerol kinase family enzyme